MKACVDANAGVVNECVTTSGAARPAAPPATPVHRSAPAWHTEITFSQGGSVTGCPDGLIERIWHVYPDSTRDIVYGGCPVANNGSVKTPPPAPAAIAQQAPIPTGGIGLNPKVTGLCGLETRYWYDGPTTMPPFTTTLNGYSVTAQLHIAALDWNFDDNGAHQTSTDPGRDEHPSATHTYAVKGLKHVSLTITWAGTYTFQGPDGVLGTGTLQTTTTAARDYQVIEIQPVIVTGPEQ